MLCFIGAVAAAQTAADSTAHGKVNQAGTEQIEGIWGLSEYLGKKLVREFGSRFNLGRETQEQKQEPVKVSIRIGPFRMERTEFR